MDAPDLTSYHAVHTSLRLAAHRLAAHAPALAAVSAKELKAFRSYWKGYVGEIVSHHTIEDDFFFPALVERVPDTHDVLARLGTEHHDLDDLMTRSTAAIDRIATGVDGSVADAASVLTELAAHMDAHLDLEDADVLPKFESDFGGEEYGALEDNAMKSLGIGKQAAFTVPFVATSLPQSERDSVLAGAPVPFRVLYLVTRGHHQRMLTAAFGDEVLRAS